MLAYVEIVLPCYNPSDTWPNELLSFYNSAKAQYDLNFILVNDGSVNSKKIELHVAEIVQKGIKLRYLSYPKNMGKGYALRTGIRETTGNCILYTDVDFPFSNTSVEQLIERLQTGTEDVIAGSRDQNYYKESMSGFRKLLSKAFRSFLKKILRLPVTDTQCGLKGFNKKGRDLFLATRINRYLFDFEFIYIACKKKELKTGVINVQLKHNVVFSKMRVKILLQELLNLIYILLFK